MRFYWLRDKLIQKEFDFSWDKSSNNKADYHTKHHPVVHHRQIRPQYVFDKSTRFQQADLQGCAGMWPRANIIQTSLTSPGVSQVDTIGESADVNLASGPFSCSA